MLREATWRIHFSRKSGGKLKGIIEDFCVVLCSSNPPFSVAQTYIHCEIKPNSDDDEETEYFTNQKPFSCTASERSTRARNFLPPLSVGFELTWKTKPSHYAAALECSMARGTVLRRYNLIINYDFL